MRQLRRLPRCLPCFGKKTLTSSSEAAKISLTIASFVQWKFKYRVYVAYASHNGRKPIGTGWQAAKWVIFIVYSWAILCGAVTWFPFYFETVFALFFCSDLFHLVRAWNGKRKYNSSTNSRIFLNISFALLTICTAHNK